MFQFKFITKLFALLLLTGLVLTSCNKDDDTEESEGCASLTTLNGNITFNGESSNLIIAQLLVSDFAGSTTYVFQIGATTDCEVVTTSNITVAVETGTSVTGTYDIIDFFDADDGDAYGSIFTQNLLTLSQSSSDIASGTVSVTDNSNNNFTLDISAMPISGASVEMELTHQF